MLIKYSLLKIMLVLMHSLTDSMKMFYIKSVPQEDKILVCPLCLHALHYLEAMLIVHDYHFSLNDNITSVLLHILSSKNGRINKPKHLPSNFRQVRNRILWILMNVKKKSLNKGNSF